MIEESGESSRYNQISRFVEQIEIASIEEQLVKETLKRRNSNKSRRWKLVADGGREGGGRAGKPQQ